MSNKRFTFKDNLVLQNGKVWVVAMGEHNADVIATAMNELSDENKKLNDLIEELKQELFDCKKEYYEETYYDNPIRAEQHIIELKDEFKERFGRDFE